MGNIQFRLVPAAGFNKQLIRGVKRAVASQVRARISAMASSIIGDIGSLLASKFENTVVAKSLRGSGPVDLPAHFGLSDSRANDLADGMAGIIRTSVNIILPPSDSKFLVTVRAVERNWSRYLDLPGAEYTSHPSEITIPVVRWMLADPNIDIGQAAYDIVFFGDYPKYDAIIHKVSRSGRAIMASIDGLGGGGGYVLPSIISGGLGQNFVEMALGQPGVARDVLNLVISRVI